MIRVALHSSIALPDEDVDSVIERLAADAGCGSAAIVHFDNAIDAADALAGEGGYVTDLFICAHELTGSNGIDVIAEAKESLPYLRSVLVASSEELAAQASAAGVDGFVVAAQESEDFCIVVGRQMRLIANLLTLSFTVASRNGGRRIPYSRVIYCETQGHDQVIHLLDEESCAFRASSQTLFEMLGGDGRFFKVGSSSIVNLDEVTEVRSSNGTVELSDSTVLNVPVRVRKALENALLGKD